MPNTPLDGVSESSRSPIRMMAEILKDERLSAADKQLLYTMAKTRFWHRRTLAYVALAGMLGFGVLDFFSVGEADMTWINSTLSAVVVAYIGAAAVRPGS